MTPDIKSVMVRTFRDLSAERTGVNRIGPILAGVFMAASSHKPDPDCVLPIGKVTKAIGKKRAPRKKPDPNAPKRPLSAFMHWGQNMRPRLKAENPQISFGLRFSSVSLQ